MPTDIKKGASEGRLSLYSSSSARIAKQHRHIKEAKLRCAMPTSSGSC
jgi:hypothetical protein